MATVLQWVKKLEAQIAAQQVYVKPFELRYSNEYVLPFIAAEYRDVYGSRADGVLAGILEAPRGGLASTVVDALTQRLTLTGATSEDRETNRALAEAWEDNDLDVMHREGHRESLIGARSFAAATRSLGDGTKAVLTIESCEQATVHRMQAPPYDVDAYLKIWKDEWTGSRHGLLQLPDWDYDLIEGQEHRDDPEGSDVSSRWVVVGDPKPRPGPVPVAELAHRPRLLKPPTSEIARLQTIIDIGDLVEGLTVFAGHFGAVPLRWAKGLEVPRDPKDPSKPMLDANGKPMIGFDARADKFWASTSKDTEFGQMVPMSLEPLVAWSQHVDSLIRRQTSIASTYFALDIKSHMSAELLKTDEAPMVRRILEMGRDGVLNQAWRRAFGHMMRIEGHRGRIKPQWADPNTRMEAQAVDSFQKAVASGLGVKVAAEQFLGWSPDLVEKAVAEAEEAESRRRAEEVDPIERLSREFLGGDPALLG